MKNQKKNEEKNANLFFMEKTTIDGITIKSFTYLI